MCPATTHGLTVAGVGTRLSRDDGIGPALVEALAAETQPARFTTQLWEDADALTLAQCLLELEGPALLVDCADMGLDSGAWRLFACGDAKLKIAAGGAVSTHGLGIADALSIAMALGYGHALHLFGVQPFDLSPRPGLTLEMQGRFPVLVAALRDSAHALVETTVVTEA